MSTLGNQVIQFNETYSVPASSKPRLPNDNERSRIIRLIDEEVDETREALLSGNIVDIAKEMGDILYVTAQQMATLGLPVDGILREIQASNMSKLDDDGMPIFREDGKVLKGPNFFKAEAAVAKLLVQVSADV